MKKISKVLAVVLALTMLVASSVLPASAADLENASLKLSFKDVDGNAITSATNGSVIDVFVSLKVDAYVQAMQFYVNYNSDYVKHGRQNSTATNFKDPSSANAGVWMSNFALTDKVEPIDDPELAEIDDANEGYCYYLQWGMGTKSITPWNPDTMPAHSNASTQGVKVVYATKTDDQTLLVNTKGEYQEIIRMRFMATQDISSLSQMFFFDNNYDKVIINIDSENVPFSVLAVNEAKNLNVSFEYEGGVTPPPAGDPITVENITTQVQWQDKDAGKMRVAFRGNIKNYTLNLVDGSQTEIADISEMGVVYSKSNTNPTVGGENCTPAPAWTIYDFTTGGYFFRAVVGNYQYDNTETLYANAYIIIDEQTIYASNAPIETTGAQAYAAGVANGMSAK
ncbi:MAG: hypothetical protein E7556_07025 [Ruminococcaceae bacterium]|nr:hypothetical protein [Oscillospiraceae bacterium]